MDNGDYRDLMLKNKGDLIVTDPPYAISSGGSKGNVLGGHMSNDRYSNDGHIAGQPVNWVEFVSWSWNVLKDSAESYVMVNAKNLEDCLRCHRQAGFKLHNILCWDKGKGPMNRWYMKTAEFVCYFWKGKARTINSCGSGMVIKIPNNDKAGHPTGKPVSLNEFLISQSSDEGDLIIDPFFGAGSCAVAACNLKRRFVGTEINPEYYQAATKRVETQLFTNQHRDVTNIF